MPFLVRKITRSKWPKDNYEKINVNELSADTITNCLRTKRNTLSTWEINNLDSVEEAALALVSSAQHLDSIFVVILDKEEIINQGFELENTPGLTPVPDLKGNHIDIANLTLGTLGEFAFSIIEGLKRDRIRIFTQGTLKKLLKGAIERGRLNPEDLHENIRKKIIA